MRQSRDRRRPSAGNRPVERLSRTTDDGTGRLQPTLVANTILVQAAGSADDAPCTIEAGTTTSADFVMQAGDVIESVT